MEISTFIVFLLFILSKYRLGKKFHSMEVKIFLDKTTGSRHYNRNSNSVDFEFLFLNTGRNQSIGRSCFDRKNILIVIA